jgi:hypothetical protein
MQRTILIALATAVVAAAIAAGATILLTDDTELAIPTAPPPSATRTPLVLDPFGKPETVPDNDASTQPAPAPRGSASAAPVATAAPSTPVRSAKTVDCDAEEQKCSRPYGVERESGRVHLVPFDDPGPSYSGVPTISMSSEFRKKDGSRANDGDPLDSIHVEVTVQNKTEKTFVFARREIALDIYRNGRIYDTLVTNGEGFDMTPGGTMTAKFDRPLTSDGDYMWQAKTWYYEK